MNKDLVYSIIDSFQDVKIAVVGDIMLDLYILGEATRLSQEAPVPVVKVGEIRNVAGGAANVACNIMSLGGQCSMFGAVGYDDDGDKAINLLAEVGTGTANILRVPNRTTVKARVVAGGQQVARADFEDIDDFPVAIKEALLSSLRRGMKDGDFDAVILEDYAKGLFSKSFMKDIVCACVDNGIPCFLDPSPLHPFDIRGVSMMTPNVHEAFKLAGMKECECYGQRFAVMGRHLMDLWGLDRLMVTLGAEGMALFRHGQDDIMMIPTEARQVFDVSGAGDTAMSVAAMAIASHADDEYICRLANAAAGIVVGKVGTSIVSAQELRDFISLNC